MSWDFFKNLKNVLLSLRFSILSIFITMFVLAMLLLITINYLYSSKTLLLTAEKLMSVVSSSLTREFKDEVEMAEKDSELSAQLIQHDLLDIKNFNVLSSYTYDLAYRFYIVQSAYWGDANGGFVITEYAPDDSIVTQIYDRTKNPGLHLILHRSENGKVTKKIVSNDMSFDPRERPWYLAAKASKKSLWTDVYQYKPNNKLGITLATPVYDDGKFLGVFGVDIRLDWLSWYVGQQQQKISKNGFLFVMTSDGKMIAYPGYEDHTDTSELIDVHALKQEGVAKAFDIFKKTGQTDFSFKENGQTYLAVYNVIPSFAMHGWLIGVVVPESDFTGDLKRSSLINVGISLTVLLLGILLVSDLVTKVVNPLKKLVHETRKIKQFDLKPDKKIKSHIKEIMYLSNAISAMKAGLRSFQRYVPASLVRQLIETGESVRKGGSRRHLAVLFSDINNFTALTEHMDPDELMLNMCEYFEALTHIIIEEQGTVDKYIGDSVMAFWGAPLHVDALPEHAARAALKCVKRLNELNADWQMQGKPRFETRFGINLGVAVVGNVGSKERLNYTVLGDTVNMASRLENINKTYGTTILVSESLYQSLQKEFVLRMVDSVTVRGKSSNENIYELMAQDKTDLAFDIDEYRRLFRVAFTAYQNQRWDDAIELFKHCITVYPGDTVAPLFVSRCFAAKTRGY